MFDNTRAIREAMDTPYQMVQCKPKGLALHSDSYKKQSQRHILLVTALTILRHPSLASSIGVPSRP